MPQRESAIVGRNNVRAQVTGQEELLVKVNSFDPTATLPVSATIVSPIGQNIMDESISVALASDQLGIARTTGLLRPTGSGNVNTVPASGRIYSVSVANVGAANGSVLGGVGNIKPGEVLNFSADAVNNYFTSFAYDATGTEFIIIFVY
jgi:hypothetical protein